MTTEARVGAFVLSGLLLLAVTIFRLGDFTLEKRYPVYASFRDVSGLPDKAIVKLSGVEVGKVSDLKLEDGSVTLTLKVKQGVRIYRDAHFRIGATSIIGSKFLDIEQGHSGSGVVEAGETVRGEETIDLVKAAGKALESVQKLIDGMNGKDNLGENLNVITRNLRETTNTMNELLADTKPQVTDALDRLASITAKLDSILSKTDQVMAKVNSSSGTVGTLLTDQKMADDVKSTVSDLRDAAGSAKNLLGGIDRFHVFWSYDSRYEPAAKASRGDIGLRIVPRPWRYYYLGVSNMTNPSDLPRGPDFERKNTIDARLGWVKENAYDVYAGLIRGGGGVGIKVHPLPNVDGLRRVSLVAEAYDFLRNRVINGRTFSSPEYDVGTEVQVHRLVSVGARVQDLAETTRFETQVNVTFEDKDIGYLLGLLTFGSTTAVGKGGDK